MSGRVCYISRTDRGSRIDKIRLVGARTDEQWTAPGAAAPGEDGELFEERPIAQAAEWVRARTLGEKGRTGELGLICLDSEGYAASWITSPSAEARVVSSVASAGVTSEEAGSQVGPGLSFYLPSEREAGVQALAIAVEPTVKGKGGKAELPVAAAALRVPVLAGADAPVRLLIDLLDQNGIVVDGVTSIWHAMAKVWGAAPVRSGGDVVADDSGVTAVVLVDPRGRLLWCWSHDGDLMAGGSLRLAAPTTVGRVPTPGPGDAARIVSDWIAWGAQLGIVPRRVACIAADDPVGVGEESAAYRAGQFGAKLAGAWGGAGVDLVMDSDPIGATMARLAATIADQAPDEQQIRGLEALTKRPGRVQKWMHHWLAIGLAAGAVLFMGAAYKLRASASRLGEAAEAEDQRWRSLVQASYPNLMKLSGDVDIGTELNKLINRYEQERERTKIEPTRPIVQELDTLSRALGDSEIELESITFSSGSSSQVMVIVLVPDIKAAEQVFKSLSSIGGSNIESWSPPQYTNAGTKIKGTFIGKWRNTKLPAATAPAPATRPAAPAQSPAQPKPAPGGAPAASPTSSVTPATPKLQQPPADSPESSALPPRAPKDAPKEKTPSPQPGAGGGR
ncbi:MAG: hypothetical protein U0573_01665 [Phycisphaerales bacterium]|nr:hypothetical protein [Planctomycetota bacterium]